MALVDVEACENRLDEFESIDAAEMEDARDRMGRGMGSRRRVTWAGVGGECIRDECTSG